MYIAIDIGGTYIRIASSESIDAVQIIDKSSFTNSPGYEANMHAILSAIRQWHVPVQGVGVGMPGRLNETKSGIVHTRSVPQWVGKPITEPLVRAFNCPVLLNGDQYCAALGEALTTKRHDDFWCITYGTGIGAAMVHYTANLPQVQRVNDDVHATYLHPWQSECGGRWAEESYGKPLSELSEVELGTVMERFYSYLLTFIQSLDPPRLVFAGGVATKQWSRLQTVFARLHTENEDLRDFEITLAERGEESALYGAFGLLRNSNSS